MPFDCLCKIANNHQEQVENNQKEAVFNVIKLNIKNSPEVKKKIIKHNFRKFQIKPKNPARPTEYRDTTCVPEHS